MMTKIPAPPSTAHLALPFFDEAHRSLARDLLPWCAAQEIDERDDRAACREWVRRLGDGGWLRYAVPGSAGGALDRLDSRALVLLRETLGYHSPLADFAFAMQGLGSGAITLAGTPEQQSQYLTAVGKGEKIAAFALSERDAGSDVAAMAMSAEPTAEGWRLNGAKTWISNGGIADFYCVFAKTDPTGGTRGITVFIVDAKTPGLDTSEHIDVMAPHPLATLRFDNCIVPRTAQLGELNGGFKLAMRTLDIFRAAVGDVSAAAAMAKMCATENASRVIDMALQMHGGLGVKVGTKIESLYRDIRSLRIYEGATEVQQLIIGKSVLRG
jgi:acyl-CoA dehydrogenase